MGRRQGVPGSTYCGVPGPRRRRRGRGTGMDEQEIRPRSLRSFEGEPGRSGSAHSAVIRRRTGDPARRIPSGSRPSTPTTTPPAPAPRPAGGGVEASTGGTAPDPKTRANGRMTTPPQEARRDDRTVGPPRTQADILYYNRVRSVGIGEYYRSNRRIPHKNPRNFGEDAAFPRGAVRPRGGPIARPSRSVLYRIQANQQQAHTCIIYTFVLNALTPATRAVQYRGRPGPGAPTN
jgi:hypothetical protein